MKFYGQTHTGMVRKNNEDAFAHDGSLSIGVLADGMGGLNAGEVASSRAIDALLQALHDGPADSADDLVAGFVSANRKVFDLASQDRRYANMGTTLVACAVFDPEEWTVAHVGDSRAYLWREGALEPITQDHSVVQQMLDEGLISEAQARNSSQRHIITRAVGIEQEIEVELSCLPRVSGDWILLCSDGLTDLLTDEEIASVLNDGKPEKAIGRLIDQANAAGGTDNVTVLMMG